MRRTIGRIVPVLLVLIAAGPIAAQDTSDNAAVPPVAPPPRVGVEGAPVAMVSLDDAIRIALEQNHDVEIARLELAASRQDVIAAEGAFDPRLTPSLAYESATTPTVSTIGGGAGGSLSQKQWSGDLQFTGRAPSLGSRFTVDFNGSRLLSNNQFARVNPQFPASLGATFTQPLLRNLGIDADRRQVLLFKRATDLTDAQLTQVVMEQLLLIEQAYWELAFTVGNVAVEAEALGQARAQVESNGRQVQQGTLAAIDVVEAQTQVSTLEQNLASAQQALTEAENQLKSLMLSDRASPMWNQPLVPSSLQDRPVPTMTVADAMQMALANRPELTQLAAQVAQNDVNRRFFRNQARPQVDLVGSYTLSGLAGTLVTTAGNPLQNASDAALLARLNDLSLRAGLEPLVPVPTTTTTLPDFLQGGLPASLSNIFNRRFPTALIQLQLDLPLRNRTAEGNEARADIEGHELQERRRQLEQSVESEVRNALQRVRSADQRLRSAGSAQRGAREQYDSERRRFDSGLSTVFLVLQRQTAFVAAQGQELRARADLNQAVAEFDRAVGGTLTQHQVVLQR